jgi:hypothetical protein
LARTYRPDADPAVVRFGSWRLSLYEDDDGELLRDYAEHCPTRRSPNLCEIEPIWTFRLRFDGLTGTGDLPKTLPKSSFGISLVWLRNFQRRPGSYLIALWADRHRAHLPVVARLRQTITPEVDRVAWQALARRDELEAGPSPELFCGPRSLYPLGDPDSR